MSTSLDDFELGMDRLRLCVRDTFWKENRTRRADRQVTLTSDSAITYKSGGYRARTGDLLAASYFSQNAEP